MTGAWNYQGRLSGGGREVGRTDQPVVLEKVLGRLSSGSPARAVPGPGSSPRAHFGMRAGLLESLMWLENA